MSTKCITCNKPHWLRDEDAGSDMEILKLCKKCYNERVKRPEPRGTLGAPLIDKPTHTITLCKDLYTKRNNNKKP